MNPAKRRFCTVFSGRYTVTTRFLIRAKVSGFIPSTGKTVTESAYPSLPLLNSS
jgi:hypothetical protein